MWQPAASISPAIDFVKEFAFACVCRMPDMLAFGLAAPSLRPIRSSSQRVFSPPSLAPAAFPPGRLLACPPWAPLSPRAGPFSLPGGICPEICMADMSASGLSIGGVEYIYRVSLRRAPISSSLRTPHRDTELRIVSSSLDPRLMAERHFLLPCSLPHFRALSFGTGPFSFRSEPVTELSFCLFCGQFDAVPNA
jgi:hypothetical protein